MLNRQELIDRASKASDKKAAIGPDIDLMNFVTSSEEHDYLPDDRFHDLPEDEKNLLLLSGV
ncbi:MAG: SufD family Fe-S cluster assembly protein, partial [Deltaproteobacteria bacterium]|nr:SufD family Fe-S cluster assembly protein [Deltaproteobacteria bacterium]